MFAMVALPDGSHLLSGMLKVPIASQRKVLMGLIRVTADGSLDPRLQYFGEGWGVARGAAGETIYDAGGTIRRLGREGRLDTNFTAKLTGGRALAIGIQADGDVVLGGNFSQCGVVPRPGSSDCTGRRRI